MRTVALLVLLLGLPYAHASAQEADAPEGAVIDSVEMSGFSPYSLSPGLQKEFDSLVGAPLNRERLNQIAARIEGEQPEMVAAVRSMARPDGKARVVFLVARISDDTDLSENINARYVVESVEIEGPSGGLSQQLRDDLQKLVGKRLDTEEADRLKDRLENELQGRDIARRISKGSEAGRIRVVFEIVQEPWIRFAPTRSKLVYHAEQGWSGVLDLPFTGAGRHRFTAGVVFNDIDELIEEYSGFRLGFESRKIGTDKLGVRLDFARFNETWEDATLSALALNPTIPEPYRNRLTFEPAVTFAFSPSVRFTGGVSLSDMESLSRAPDSQSANAWVAGITADHTWRTSDGSASQSFEAGYGLRAAVDGLGSDLFYKRHLGHASYRYKQGRNEALGSISLGYISGEPPLFERFSLGNSSTLRGFDKYDIAPTGGERMFHSSIEYRYAHVGVFFDTGSVWDRDGDAKIRYSTGFGVNNDNFFLLLGFPLNGDDATPIFMTGVRF